MKSMKKIFLLFLIIALALTNVVFANTISYDDNGNIETVIVNEGKLEYNNGILSSIVTSDISVFFNNGKLTSIITSSGTIFFNAQGSISTSAGNKNEIIQDAQTSIQQLYSEIEEYFKAININVSGAANPISDLDFISSTLNNALNNQSTSSEIENNNNTNNFDQSSINVGGIQLGNGINVNGNVGVTSGSQVNSSNNDENINVTTNGSAQITENSVNTNIAGTEIGVGSGINVGDDITVDSNGNIDVNGIKINNDNNIFKYIIIGLLCFVAFLIIIFGAIKIKSQNGQLKIRDKK